MDKIKGIIAGIIVGMVFSIPYFVIIFAIEKAFFLLAFLIGMGVVYGYKMMVKNHNEKDLIFVLGTTLLTVVFCVILSNSIFLSKELGFSLGKSISFIVDFIKIDPALMFKDHIMSFLLAGFGAFSAFN